jgi:predicted nucleic acid-binding protein
MASAAVVNASPLIFLAAADSLDFLRGAADTVLVPSPVLAEVAARGKEAADVQMVRQAAWLIEVPPAPVPPTLAAWDLGVGETAVLAAALGRPGALVVMDDAAGRRCARAFGLPLRGTLGLVLRAKMEGRIEAARPVLEALRARGMYLSDRVLNAALAEVGE